jgi:sodium-dependent dicarboxylate transporter 2/3/5
MRETTSRVPAVWRLHWRFWFCLALAVVTALGLDGIVDNVVLARGVAVAAVCLSLWLLEAVPPFVPTLVLVGAVPIVLAGQRVDGVDDAFALWRVLQWGAEPVVALFFGGFVLAAAAQATQLDVVLARVVLWLARGRVSRLVVVVAVGAAALSMWMSNIAAAALLLTTLAPALVGLSSSNKRAVLLALAMGANLGGMASPVGSGPNAIAIAALHGMSFVRWMLLGVPLAAGSLALALVLIWWRLRPAGVLALTTTAGSPAPLSRRARMVVAVFVFTIAAWLLEPLHHVPSASVAMVAAATLCIARILDTAALQQLDWSTLLVVVGGIVLGRLLERCGALGVVTPLLEPLRGHPASVAAIVLIAALLSALMSNTATATLLIPIADVVTGDTSAAVLVAMACSLGVPFVISTPQNAMVVGDGVTSRDLLVVGLPVMLVMGVLVAVTGPAIVAFVMSP